MGCVSEILIAASPVSEMVSTPRVRAVPGKGLDGDRYFLGIGTFSPKPNKADFEITLIEQENVLAFAADSGLAFTPSLARRNIVTQGIRLNELVGKEFYLGEVQIRGIRLCEPCSHLGKTSFPEVLKGLVHKGGLRAQILSEGEICVGDEIRVMQP
jgi:MOSC domain-containing protein YiiM